MWRELNRPAINWRLSGELKCRSIRYYNSKILFFLYRAMCNEIISLIFEWRQYWYKSKLNDTIYSMFQNEALLSCARMWPMMRKTVGIRLRGDMINQFEIILIVITINIIIRIVIHYYFNDMATSLSDQYEGIMHNNLSLVWGNWHGRKTTAPLGASSQPSGIKAIHIKLQKWNLRCNEAAAQRREGSGKYSQHFIKADTMARKCPVAYAFSHKGGAFSPCAINIASLSRNKLNNAKEISTSSIYNYQEIVFNVPGWKRASGRR